MTEYEDTYFATLSNDYALCGVQFALINASMQNQARSLFYQYKCFSANIQSALRNYVIFHLPTYTYLLIFRNALSQFGLDLRIITALRNYQMTL